MTYREIVLELAQDQVEALSEALLEHDAILSISVEDAHAGEEQEQALFGEPGLEPEVQAWQQSRLVLLIDANTDPANLLSTLQHELALDAALFSNYVVRELPEQDWVRLTQAQFAPISIGKRIWIVPSWHSIPAQKDIVTIELDPGMAFGTGSHPTTQLCIQWLESHLQTGSNVLDYGCGSGILAIVAKKLGANNVSGIDIDANAIIAARDNAQRNQVAVNFFLPDDSPTQQWDIVVANILSNPLKLMAAMLSAKVKPGGQLVLSGVLARQAEEVIASYAPWIQLSVWKEAEGWVCLANTPKTIA